MNMNFDPNNNIWNTAYQTIRDARNLNIQDAATRDRIQNSVLKQMYLDDKDLLDEQLMYAGGLPFAFDLGIEGELLPLYILDHFPHLFTKRIPDEMDLTCDETLDISEEREILSPSLAIRELRNLMEIDLSVVPNVIPLTEEQENIWETVPCDIMGEEVEIELHEAIHRAQIPPDTYAQPAATDYTAEQRAFFNAGVDYLFDTVN